MNSAKVTIKKNDVLAVKLVKGNHIKVTVKQNGIGKSAYQHWLDQGNTGTEADFLQALTQQLDPVFEQRLTAAETLANENLNNKISTTDTINGGIIF